MAIREFRLTPISMKQPGRWETPPVLVDPVLADEWAVMTFEGDDYQTEPGLTVTWAIEKSDDGLTWSTSTSTSFPGGRVPRFTPRLQVSIDGLRGKFVRAWVETDTRVRFGVNVEVGLKSDFGVSD